MGDWGYWILISVGIIVGVLVLLTLIGAFLPSGHRVSRSLVLTQTPETVWQVITNFAEVPQWHAGVMKVERLPDRNGHEAWKETFRNGYGLSLETTEQTPPTKLLRTIIPEGEPFTGCWEFVLVATEPGCRVTITEIGEIRNPFFRVMARLFMKPETYVVLYLTALAKKFNEPAVIEKVPTPAASSG